MTPAQHRETFARIGVLIAVAEEMAQDLAWEHYSADFGKTPEELFEDAAHLSQKLAELRRDWAHHFPKEG